MRLAVSHSGTIQFVTVSDAVAVASFAVSVVAIWLAITLYRWSNETTKELRGSSSSIAESTRTLEKLFDKTLERAFRMVDEAYGDIRKHAWPDAGEAEQAALEAEQKTAAIVSDVMTKVDDVVKRQGSTQDQITDINRLVRGMVRETREIEAQERQAEIRSAVLEILRAADGPIPARVIVDPVRRDLGLSASSVVLTELRRLKGDGLLAFEDPIRPSTPIRVVRSPASGEAEDKEPPRRP